MVRALFLDEGAGVANEQPLFTLRAGTSYTLGGSENLLMRGPVVMGDFEVYRVVIAPDSKPGESCR